MAKRLVGLKRKSFVEIIIDHLKCLANRLADDNVYDHRCKNKCPQKELCEIIERKYYEKLYM